MLQVDDIIVLKEGMTVYADIPEHFVYSNRRGSFESTRHEVTIGGQFDYLAGKYIVTKTLKEGGGTGHGPHDIFPDGHHVFCEKIIDKKIKVDFYQSGCFTAMIKDITPIEKINSLDKAISNLSTEMYEVVPNADRAWDLLRRLGNRLNEIKQKGDLEKGLNLKGANSEH